MNEELEILKEYIKISEYRYKIIKVLDKDSVKIPTQISVETNIRINHISKILKELKDMNLIECINEHVRKGRLYRLTSLGDEVKNEIISKDNKYKAMANFEDYTIAVDNDNHSYTVKEIINILNNADIG